MVRILLKEEDWKGESKPKIMISKNERYSFKKGIPKKTIVTPFFSLRYETKDKPDLRIGVVVGKKVDKLATKRNELKRRFIEVAHRYLKTRDVKGDFVFYLKDKYKDATEDQTVKMIEESIVRAN